MTEQLREKIALRLARWKADIVYSVETKFEVLFASPIDITDELLPYMKLAEQETFPTIQIHGVIIQPEELERLLPSWRKVDSI